MRSALTNFQASLVRVENITHDIDANAIAALALRSIRERHETTQCACAAILSGFFEAFLKDVAEGFIGGVSALRIPFNALPEAVRKAHYGNGGTVLNGKQTNKGKFLWVSASPDDIARRLASVSSVPYELLWEAFADTQSNPTPDAIREMLRAFGLAKPWSKVSFKTGITENSIITQLTSFLAVRNECAHTGTALSIPTPSDIRGHCAFLSKLGLGIVESLEDHLASADFNRSLSVPLLGPGSITASVSATPLATSAKKSNFGLRWFWEHIRNFLRR